MQLPGKEQEGPHEASHSSSSHSSVPSTLIQGYSCTISELQWRMGNQAPRNREETLGVPKALTTTCLFPDFRPSPEGISLLKVIFLETRHSCSGLGCLLQPSKVCKAICCLILCSLAISQVSVQRGNRLSCARMADKHQQFCWLSESIIIIWNYILQYLVIHCTLVIIAVVHLHFQV